MFTQTWDLTAFVDTFFNHDRKYQHRLNTKNKNWEQQDCSLKLTKGVHKMKLNSNNGCKASFVPSVANSFASNDDTWWQRTRSTLVHVITCAWWHQAITWTNVQLSYIRSNDIHLRATSQEILQPSVSKISLKIIYHCFHANLPGANHLNWAKESLGYYMNGCNTLFTQEYSIKQGLITLSNAHRSNNLPLNQRELLFKTRNTPHVSQLQLSYGEHLVNFLD